MNNEKEFTLNGYGSGDYKVKLNISEMSEIVNYYHKNEIYELIVNNYNIYNENGKEFTEEDYDRFVNGLYDNQLDNFEESKYTADFYDIELYCDKNNFKYEKIDIDELSQEQAEFMDWLIYEEGTFDFGKAPKQKGSYSKHVGSSVLEYLDTWLYDKGEAFNFIENSNKKEELMNKIMPTINKAMNLFPKNHSKIINQLLSGVDDESDKKFIQDNIEKNNNKKHLSIKEIEKTMEDVNNTLKSYKDFVNKEKSKSNKGKEM